MKDQEYSIVIASIGRRCLNETLNDILVSSKHPSEVIIVLPENSNFVLGDKYKDCDIDISVSYSSKGQVKQRKVGLLKCNYDIIVQLDDDIRFDETLLGSLVDKLSKNPNMVISPLFYDHDLDCKTGVKARRNTFLKFIFGTDEEGTLGTGHVSKTGLAIRPSSFEDRDFIPSDWLPGGCMAYSKKFSSIDAEIENPIGKFYGEDIINSFIMKKKGAELYFATKASVKTEFVSSLDIRDAVSHFKSMVFIQKITHGRTFYCRTILFCLIRYIHSSLIKKYEGY